METEPRVNLRPGLIASGIITGVMLLMSAWAWPRMPSGEKAGLIVVPLATAFVAALMLVIAWQSRRNANLARSMKAYNAAWFATLGVIAVLQIACVQGIVRGQTNLDDIIDVLAPVLMGVLFVVCGNYMGKTRPNKIIGVKTKWTLTSDLSWGKSNRLGGWMLVLLGIVVILVALLMRNRRLVILTGVIGAVATTLILVPYSYLVWKADPNKRS